MTVSFTTLKADTAGIDSRIASKTDAEILSIINEGISLLSSQTQCFSNSEDIPFEDYINAGIFKFTINPIVDEIVDYYEIHISEPTEVGFEKVHGSQSVHVSKQNDRSLICTVLNADQAKPQFLSIKYFYTPILGLTGSMILESEVYNMLKTAINIVVWNSLKDYEKEDYHTKSLILKKKTKTISTPNDFFNEQDIAESFIKGGFV